jgi:hypothetical protein
VQEGARRSSCKTLCEQNALKILICEQHSESSFGKQFVSHHCCLQQQNESSFVATISLPSKCGVANVSQFKLL